MFLPRKKFQFWSWENTSTSTRFQARACFFQQTRCREDNFCIKSRLLNNDFAEKSVCTPEISYSYSDLKASNIFLTPENSRKTPKISLSLVGEHNGTVHWLSVLMLRFGISKVRINQPCFFSNYPKSDLQLQILMFPQLGFTLQAQFFFQLHMVLIIIVIACNSCCC